MNAKQPVPSAGDTSDGGNGPNTVEGILAAHPFLRGLNPHQRRLLTDCAMISHFAPGEVIFREGDPANRFYLIQQGSVALESHVRGSGTVRIETIGSGDILGWSWLFPPYYWHFAARALEPTTAVFFYGTPLRDECDSDHDLGYELMKRMAEVVIQRLQAARRQLLENNGLREAGDAESGNSIPTR